jgi:hypothetical protein
MRGRRNSGRVYGHGAPAAAFQRNPRRRPEQRKGKGGGRKAKRQQVGSRCQRLKGKRKIRAVQWAAAGGLGGPTGLAGPKGERLSFSFFLFFFKLLLKQLFFSNSNQTLSNFFSKIL